MANKKIQPILYIRKVIQPNGKIVEVITTQNNAKDYILPMNMEEHPAWSQNPFGSLNNADKNKARTRNTGSDIFGI